jgi:sugar phosphate permease
MVFSLQGRISWPSLKSFHYSLLAPEDKTTPNADDLNAPLLHQVDSHGDSVLAFIGDERVKLTDEDNKRICHKTDHNILPILIWVYFLQVLDKTTLGYAAVFDLERDTGLTGRQYSLIGSIAPFAQLLWQPFSSWLIVKVPHRILVSALVLGWGISQASMAACNSYTGLMITRFFLGLFEAGCLPVFSVITSQWYRRQEQPMRIAAWYSMNGIANVTAAGLAFGLGHIKSDLLLPWQT